MIELVAISKSLGQKLILSNVSLSVSRGDILGVAGPVGAGKSTLLYIISGLLDPDKGSVRISGLPMLTHRQDVLQQMNYASSSQRLSGYASVIENLMTYGRLYEISDTRQKIENLWAYFAASRSLFQKKTYRLSSGENSFVNLAKSLINDPSVLLLDEITAHMDPKYKSHVHALLKKRAAAGRVAVVVSQNVEELRTLCNRVVVLSRGKILYNGKPLSADRIQAYYA